MKSWILFICVALFSMNAVSAVKPAVVSHQGGVAGTGFSLLAAELRQIKNKERLVIEVGDNDGGKFFGRPGYYYAEYKIKSGELRVDFSQMPTARLQEEQLNAKLKKSKLIRHSEMLLDPVDSTLHLNFKLKPGTKIKFYEVRGKKQTAKVVIDFIQAKK